MRAARKVSEKDYTVTAVDRAIDVLEVFSEREPELLLTEISARLALPTSTVFRMLCTLAQRGLVTRETESGKYRLGYKMIGFADLAKRPNGLISKARPAMTRIRDITSETTYLTVRSGNQRIDIEQVEGTMDVRRVVALGQARPLFIGCPGRVLLSALDEGLLRKYIEGVRLVDDRYGAIDMSQLEREIKQIRKHGFAETKHKTGAGAISAPIFGPSGEVLAALTVSVPFVRYTHDLRSKVFSAVLDGARSISASMGCPDIER